MKITKSKFITSSKLLSQCPPADKPEYAFIGRSNVGKSSLINALTNKSTLAKTSSTPGKTQLINHFLINDDWYMVDLPGFGYAKISKTLREDWGKMIYNYFEKRINLLNTFLLIDARIEPQKIDTDLMEWFATKQLPFCIVFTKTDKLTTKKLAINIEAYKEQLLKDWEELPPIFITSAEKKIGLNDITDFVEKTNEEYNFNKL